MTALAQLYALYSPRARFLNQWQRALYPNFIINIYELPSTHADWYQKPVIGKLCYDVDFPVYPPFWVVANRLTLRGNLLFTAKSSGNKRTTQIPIVALLVTYLYYSVTVLKYINIQSPHIIGQPLIVYDSLSKTDKFCWDIKARRQNPESVQTMIVSWKFRLPFTKNSKKENLFPD